jgi:hypothetical protein
MPPHHTREKAIFPSRLANICRLSKHGLKISVAFDRAESE